MPLHLRLSKVIEIPVIVIGSIIILTITALVILFDR